VSEPSIGTSKRGHEVLHEGPNDKDEDCRSGDEMTSIVKPFNIFVGGKELCEGDH